MKQRNVFTKGIIDDLAYNHIKQDNWVFPTHNIRIYNKRGQGYIVSTMPGNNLLFDISEGFIIIAAKEHRGIIYLITVKEVNDIWITQIGCYPYPKGWASATIDYDIIGFDQRYSILRNYRSAALAFMETSLFKYNKQSELKLIIDDSFDESANLYLCDGVNSDKVVNSGFIYDGKINKVVYTAEDFEGKINHIIYSLKPVEVSSVSVDPGGSLKPGNYNLFFAYKTERYDTTEYNSQSFPISIFQGTSITNINGLSDDTFIDKRINLSLKNVDDSFKYVSVAVLRFFGNGTQDYAEYEAYEISKDFLISGEEFNITITGREGEKSFSTDSLFSRYLLERVSKDHCFFNSRIWKANLKSELYDKEVFIGLSQLVTVSSIDDDTNPDPCYQDVISSNGKILNTQDPNYLYQKLGYFDREIYPFAISFLLTSGVITDGYPVKGQDEKSHEESTKGLFRPFNQTAKKYGSIGIKFFIKDMLTEINAEEKYSNIRGFYIMRGERIKNMLYDGLLERTAYGVSVSQNRKIYRDIAVPLNGHSCWYYNRTNLWFAATNPQDAYHIPVFRYMHNLNGTTYPLKQSNKWSFPHATFLENLGKAENLTSTGGIDSIEKMILDPGESIYEYSLAVKEPFKTDGSNDLHSDADDKVIYTEEDALDTELFISEDHFALFSPDFMTEVKHLTEDGGEYTIEIYKGITGACYAEGTIEYDNGIPSRTRILDFSIEGESTHPTVTTHLRKSIEVLFNNVNSLMSNWTNQCDNDNYNILPWIKDVNYFGTNITNDRVVFDVNQVNDKLVTHNAGNVYMCILNTISDNNAGEDTSPTIDGNKWWELVTGHDMFSQERGNSFWAGAVYDQALGLFVKASCVYGSYIIDGEFNDGFVPQKIKVNISNIQKGTYQGRGRFSSYVEDGKEYTATGKKGLYSLRGTFMHGQVIPLLWAGELSMPMVHYNRSYQTPSFIGFSTDDFKYEDGYTYMAKVYKIDPSLNTYFSDEDDLFSPKEEQYWVISDLVYVDSKENELTVFKGDNFKSASWFRMSHSVDYDDNAKDGHVSSPFKAWYIMGSLKLKPQNQLKSGLFLDKSYSHGIMYGMHTENRRNISARSILKVSSEEDEITYTFFPRIANSGSILAWIYSSDSLSNAIESVNINDGYSHVSGFIKRLGADPDLPIDSFHKRTRIAFSERRIVDSFKDGYRSMNILNKEDFATDNGEIMRIEELYGSLITVRRRAIMKHIVGQKQITEDLQYGDSAIYLSNEEYPVLYYGIDDWGAFVKTANALYGVDVRNSIIFKIGMTSSDKNVPNTSPSLLSRVLAIEKQVSGYIEKLNDERTTAIDGNGIALGYNEDYSEVYFTFINGDYKQTLVYNESFNFFIGTCDISASLYIPFGKTILSCLEASNPLTGTIYQNDGDNAVSTFYGDDKDNILSFIVNGNTEQENTVILTKIFESLEIFSPHVKLDKILYETELQKGTYIFSEDSEEFWKDSAWIEGKWLTPIIRDQEEDDPYYESESVLRGRSLKVSLYFKAGPDFYISDIISNFTQSYS